jgi:hypothetical protein
MPTSCDTDLFQYHKPFAIHPAPDTSGKQVERSMNATMGQETTKIYMFESQSGIIMKFSERRSLLLLKQFPMRFVAHRNSHEKAVNRWEYAQQLETCSLQPFFRSIT